MPRLRHHDKLGPPSCSASVDKASDMRRLGDGDVLSALRSAVMEGGTNNV